MKSETAPSTGTDLVPIAEGKLRNTRPRSGLSKKRLMLVESMVFSGKNRQEAAAEVGLSDRAARYALSNPAVMKEYRTGLQILRESEKPKSVHRLTELRDQSESLKVALDASKFLASDEPNGPAIHVGLNVNIQPGYVVDISRHAEAARRILRENGVGTKTIEASRNS